MSGPAKSPRHLKLLKGTLRRDRHPPDAAALAGFDAVPEYPPWLQDVEALKEWRRLVPVLTGSGLLSPGNVGPFAHYCALHGKLVATWKAGATPTAAVLGAYRLLSNAIGIFRVAAPASRAENRFARHALRTGAR